MAKKGRKNSRKSKGESKAATETQSKVQTDKDAEGTLAELEDMVSPRPAPKSGFDKVEERAKELQDSAGSHPTVFGPGGETSGLGNTGPTEGVEYPGQEGPKKLNAEFIEKKGKAEEGGEDTAYTPKAPTTARPRVRRNDVALPDPAKTRKRLRGD